MAKKKSRFIELADLLEKEFAKRPVGAQAITLNELVRRFRISPGTAKRILLELQLRGIIYSRIGAGSFIAPVQRRKLILIVYDLYSALENADTFNTSFLVRALICCNLQYPQYTVAAMDFSDFMHNYELLETIYPQLKGVVLLRSILPYRKAVERLRQIGITCAFYGSSTWLRNLHDLDYLIYNEKTIVEILLEVLRERGCTTPGFVGDLSFPVFQERLRIFQKSAIRFGMNYSSRVVINTSHAALDDKNRLRRYFCDVDSIIATDDAKACQLCHLAAKLGFSVPDEIAITGINNIPNLELFSDPGITTIALDSGTDADRLIGLLIKRIEYGEAFQTESVIQLIRRGSA